MCTYSFDYVERIRRERPMCVSLCTHNSERAWSRYEVHQGPANDAIM